MVLVLIGTKAQFIKMAPVLIEMDRRGLPYRLVYTGQHSETFADLERSFGVRRPDAVLVPNFEADTHIGFVEWTWRFWVASLRPSSRALLRGCSAALVHGDTASTFFGAILARLFGIPVVHIEAGLRSESLSDPFPEEIIRRWVSRLARVHLCPDRTAVRNLHRAKGVIVDTGGNTLWDSLQAALDRQPPHLVAVDEAGPYCIVSIHRNENLSRRETFDFLMRQVQAVARRIRVRFVVHPATRKKLMSTGWWEVLDGSERITLVPRMDYFSFVGLLRNARFLMTDGGSNQEEAAMLGMPCLLLRKHTERPDGLGEGVVLSGLSEDVISDFVEANLGSAWTMKKLQGDSPSSRAVDALQQHDFFPAMTR